jgi:hypothetical protein
VLTRGAYEQSLVTDPFVVIDAETLAREGPLEPGAVREFEVAFTLDSFGLDRIGRASIRSRSTFAPLGSRSGPSAPRDIPRPRARGATRSLLTFVLEHPISFGPDGIFLNDSLEVSLSAEDA